MKTIKSTIQTIMILFIIAICMQGCQENPEADIVINKNEDVLEKAVNQKKSDDVEDIPESYEDTFFTSSNDLEVTVNAQVLTSQQTLPIVRVKPHVTTTEELKLWGDVLFEGKQAYEPTTVLSKTDIEKEIMWRMERISDEDALIQDIGEEEAGMIIESYRNEIASLEDSYEDAPDTYEKTKSDWKFHPYSYYQTDALYQEAEDFGELEQTDKFYAVTEELNGHKAVIDATSREEKDYRMHNIWFYYLDEEEMTDISYKEISEEEALTLADHIREQLKLDQWELWGIWKDDTANESSYHITYTPVYQGVPTLLGNEIDLKSEELYASNFYYELLEIRITNGIIRAIELTSPMEVVSVENENVETISFKEIYDLFKNQMQTEYAKSTFMQGAEEDPELMELLEDSEFKIEITSIQQSLFRIKIKDSTDEFRMIPTWAFSGTVYIDEEELDVQNFVVINGVDGSRINTKLGY